MTFMLYGTPLMFDLTITVIVPSEYKIVGTMNNIFFITIFNYVPCFNSSILIRYAYDILSSAIWVKMAL